jgi:hypothetical protein
MKRIYFLSIQNNYVSMISKGEKKWEFRRNPRFGLYSDYELATGDILFLVSRFASTAMPARIECMCLVQTILREREMTEHFADRETGHWLEAGCREGTARDWDFFKTNILPIYSTAIKLKPYPLVPPVETDVIRHKTKKTPWKAIGFTPASALKKFAVGDMEIDEYFYSIKHSILPD